MFVQFMLLVIFLVMLQILYILVYGIKCVACECMHLYLYYLIKYFYFLIEDKDYFTSYNGFE